MREVRESDNFRIVQEQHLETVLALTRANGDLLKARQRASGIEFDVLTAERNHAAGNQDDASNATLDDMYVLQRAAKLKLAAAENHIEKLEQRLTVLTLNLAAPDSDREATQ